MRIAIRADASAAIGGGHVMRCLSLADEIAQRGGSATFLMRKLPGHLAEQVEGRGHEVAFLEASASFETSLDDPWEPWDRSRDADRVDRIFKAGGVPDFLVVDHQRIDEAWEARFAETMPVMVLGGPADRSHRCHVLHDQIFALDHSTRWAGLVPPGCEMLVGPEFALLREEFTRRPARLRSERRGVSRIVVSLGAGDSRGVTEQALRVMGVTSALSRTELRVVVGPMNPHRGRLEQAIRELDLNATLLDAPEDMARELAWADVAVVGGGVSALECLAVGTPCIAVTWTENQARAMRDLAHEGYVDVVEVGANGVPLGLPDHMERLRSGAADLAFRSGRGLGLVDGRGARRVANALEAVLTSFSQPITA